MHKFLYVKLQIVKYTCVHEIDYKNLLQITLVNLSKTICILSRKREKYYILLLFLCGWLFFMLLL